MSYFHDICRPEELKEIFATIKTVGEMKDGAAVRGINMEGPFLDAKKKGAHVEAISANQMPDFVCSCCTYGLPLAAKTKGTLKSCH